MIDEIFLTYLADITPMEVFLIEEDGSIRYANKRGRSALGIGNPESSISNKIFEIIHHRQSLRWHRILKKTKQHTDFRFSTIHKNTTGEIYPVDVTTYAIMQKGKMIIAYYARNNHRVKKAQKSLIKEFKINKSLVEVAKELTQHEDLNSVALLVRQYALEITNSLFCFIAYNDPVKKRVSFSIYSDSTNSYRKETEAFYHAFCDYMQTRNHEAFISKCYCNGQQTMDQRGKGICSHMPYHKIAWSKIIFNKDFKGMIFVAGKQENYTQEDASHLQNLSNLFGIAIYRIQSHHDLVKSKEQAEAASKAKIAFLARMTHEIRTPINAILGFSDLLKPHMLQSAHLHFLESICHSGQTLLSLVDDILEFSKMETHQIKLKPVPLEMAVLTGELQLLFHTTIHDKNLSFAVHAPTFFPPFILMDKLRLKQILINLLGNAIKFTDQGGITLEYKVVQTHHQELDFSITIEDTGIGIIPESQKKIFQEFFQQEEQDNRKYGGTGLGLGIVKQLVDIMNGTIEVESQVGKGSRFTLYFSNVNMVRSNRDNEEIIGINEQNIIQTTNKHQPHTIIPALINESPHPQRMKFSPELISEWRHVKNSTSFKTVIEMANELMPLAKELGNDELEDAIHNLQVSATRFDVEKMERQMKIVDQMLNSDYSCKN